VDKETVALDCSSIDDKIIRRNVTLNRREKKQQFHIQVRQIFNSHQVEQSYYDGSDLYQQLTLFDTEGNANVKE
jgi:hypothetical protein